MHRYPTASVASLTLLLAACTGGNFSGSTKKAGGSGDALAEKSGPSTGTGTGTDHTVDQSGTGNPKDTVYVPLGGTKSLGPATTCTVVDKAVATCVNGTVTGVKLGTTVAYVPSGTPGPGASGSPSSPGSTGPGAGGNPSSPGAGAGGTPAGQKQVTVVVYDPKHPPTGVDLGNSQGPGGTNGVGPGIDGTNGVKPVGTLGTGDGVITSQPNPNTIAITGDKLFHIGDGQFADSTCLGLLNTYTLVGTVYWFPFTVTQANTNVQISLSTLCGIDYSDSNFLAIVPVGPGVTPSFATHQPLGIGQTTGQMSAQALQPGTYALAVKSTKGSSEATSIGDHDDFVVGGVTITATGPITPGPITATKDDDCKSAVDPTATSPACTSGVPSP